VLWEQLESARATAGKAADEIRRGRVEPAPESRARCGYCAFNDVCRLVPEAAPAGEGAGD
jgi:CRISPR/Cas system-associated exonuclease Cas4 (RecB family)